MAATEQLQIRPYARLLTMLGEQLIKNERIALIELLKNSYDADAEWAKVAFLNFGEGYRIEKDSKIIIRDSGHGMTSDIIKNHWLNPATPEKKNRKTANKSVTDKGRVLQGEKGIGRFAMLKLGRKIKIITRAKNDPNEYVLDYDFSNYDDDFLSEDGKDKELYIDDLRVSLVTRKPRRFTGQKVDLGTRKVNSPEHGTWIRISDLKGSWSNRKVELAYLDIAKLQSIFSIKKDIENDFDVCIYYNKEFQNFRKDYLEKLNLLLEDRSVIRIEDGFFDNENLSYNFKINGELKEIGLRSPVIQGLSVFQKRFGRAGKELDIRKIECGSFNFGFYVFDFSAQAPVKFKLDKSDKDVIREHRIYLYRDDIRVYPYGEPDDDWLKIDMYRGTISAGQFLSNDQVVGFVNVTQENNTKLKDKTNREGLIDEGYATDDFIALLQTILAYIRQKPYARYRADLESKKNHDLLRIEQVQKDFDELKNAIGDDKKTQKIFSKVEKGYKAERQYLARRAETTEELAGVGLSVETASHDVMAIMGKVLANLDSLIHDLMAVGEIDKDEFLKELQSVRGGLGFVESQLKDIQLLFKSSKQRRKQIRVKTIIEKVERIYKRLLIKESIKLKINTVGSPLVAKTTDAILLQLLLNLFDNSVYWLQQTSKKDKVIEVLLDGNDGVMIFSDNGPGIEKEDVAYIFEPFFSGKGNEGRGLGLYIARQLLERQEYSIELAELKSDKVLSGANFVVSFVSEKA